MIALSVSAKRLADCTVQLRDLRISQCAVVPLFDARGETVRIALLAVRTRESWCLEWRPEGVCVPLLGSVRIDLPPAPGTSTAGEPLWMYDPRGLIQFAIERLGGGEWARNAAPEISSVSGIVWRRDLARIAGVWIKKKGGVNWRKWDPKWLPDAPPRPAATLQVRPVRRWILAPTWQ
jgi:hypothetical protein